MFVVGIMNLLSLAYAQEYDIPVSSNVLCNPGEFMWDGDFQCHAYEECGVIGVDRDAMIAYHETNNLTPAQPCKCVQPDRMETLTDPGYLDGNCGRCRPYLPDSLRMPAYVGAEHATDDVCVQYPRGDPNFAYDNLRSDLTVTQTNDFFCYAPLECALRAQRSSDSTWRGELGGMDAAYLPMYIWARSTTPDTYALNSLRWMCGLMTDWAQSMAEGTCVCNANVDWTGSVTVAVNIYDSSSNGYCWKCKHGYEPTAYQHGFLCTKKTLSCPTEGTIPISSNFPLTDPRSATKITRCLPLAVACNHPLTLDVTALSVDVAAIELSGLCTSARDTNGGGGPGLIPDHEDLGLQPVIRVCDTEHGFFSDNTLPPTQCTDIRSVNYGDGYNYRRTVLVSISLHRQTQHLLPVGTTIMDVVGSRFDTIWSDPPIPVFIDSVDAQYIGFAYSNPDDIALGGAPRIYDDAVTQFLTTLQRVWTDPTHDGNTDAMRQLAVWFHCGIAYRDPPLRSVDATAPHCECVDHANMDFFPTTYDSNQRFTRNGCMCEEGYVFDRVSRTCGLAEEVCGAGVDARFRFMCICQPNITKSANGKCTSCDTGRFRPLDGCPYIDARCGTDVGLDINATVLHHECTCSSPFRSFYDQLGSRDGCYSCSTADYVPMFTQPTVCAPVADACPQRAGTDRLDPLLSHIYGQCMCKRGWIHGDTYVCDVLPSTSYADLATDTAVPLTTCGPGVDSDATRSSYRCQCNTTQHFVNVADTNMHCSVCQSPFIFDAASNTCRQATELCGFGVDSLSSFASQSCVCNANFLSFANQPSGLCEDCSAGFYRSHANKTTCQYLDESVRVFGGARRSVDEWEALMDRALVDGTGVFDEGIVGACGVQWSWSTSAPSSYRVLAVDMDLFKPIGQSPAEAQYACHHYYPCAGVAVSAYMTDEAVQLYRFVYLARMDMPAMGLSTYAQAASTDFQSHFHGTWFISRHHGTVCLSNTVDPAWYWQTWSQRLATFALHIPPIHTAVENTFPTSVRQAFDDPQSVQHHFWWVGHLARLWPNPNCAMSPLPASSRDGCRSQTCPFYDTCPSAFPVEQPHSHLCLTPDQQPTDPPTTTWTHSSLGQSWSSGGTHPEMCNEGMCTFNMDVLDTDAFRCACPRGMGGEACGTVLEGYQADADGQCAFPLRPEEIVACSFATGFDPANTHNVTCLPGFVGTQCEFLDVDQRCHTATSAGEWSTTCSGHGACSIMSGSPELQCICVDGWTGATCSIQACEQDCGPFGRCVITGEGNETVGRCACAVHYEDPHVPLGGMDVHGQCSLDLCNDHGSGQDRFGSLIVLHTFAPDGAPLGVCDCFESDTGLRNEGMFCDTPQCLHQCGIGEVFSNPLVSDQICALCSTPRGQATGRCDAGNVGAVCDCVLSSWDGHELQSYWHSVPFKYQQGPSETCLSVCNDVQYWNVERQTCLCRDDQKMGDACDVEGCQWGSFDPITQVCTSCDPHVILNNGRCATCETGYMGDHCRTCAPGFVYRLGLCVTCESMVVDYCSRQGTSVAQCVDGVPQCTCQEGYVGGHCETCSEGYWRMSIENLAVLGNTSELVPLLGSMFPAPRNTLDACAPVSSWPYCLAGGSNVERVVAPGGIAPPQCHCHAGWSNTSHTIVSTAVGAVNVVDPGNCQVCVQGSIIDGDGQCRLCADVLQCDEGGTVSLECSNPGVGTPFSTGIPNRCICDVDRGRTGEHCSTCNTQTKWVSVPNTDPVQCYQCTRECGPNGEVMCGVNLETCRCKGGWTGANCDICTFCGHGGTCAPASHDGEEWCLCDAARGYARDEALAQSDQYYKALCTSCIDGFFMQGILCRSIVDTCGYGADPQATKQANMCVCRDEFLPLRFQPSGTCSLCANTYIAVNASQCVTCSPACPAHATCQWDMVSRQPSCTCQEGFSLDNDGQCTSCTTGFLGPLCKPCSSECVGSGGNCVWNDAAHRQECICPSGTTHQLADNPTSACRPCHPTRETDVRCLPCPTCPPHSHCSEPTNTTGPRALCVCEDGYSRPPGANMYLSRCALPSEIRALTSPSFESAVIRGNMDKMYLYFTLCLFAWGLSTAGVVFCGMYVQRRCNKKASQIARVATTRKALQSSRGSPSALSPPPPPPPISRPPPPPTHRRGSARNRLRAIRNRTR